MGEWSLSERDRRGTSLPGWGNSPATDQGGGSYRRPVPSGQRVAAQSRPTPHLNTASLISPSDAGRRASLPCCALRPSPPTVAVPAVRTGSPNDSRRPTVRQQFVPHTCGLARVPFSPAHPSCVASFFFCLCARHLL